MKKTNVVMLASLSKDKTKEFQELFLEYPEFQFVPMKQIVWNGSHLSEVETGSTYYENAYFKGRIAHLSAKVPTISDDTGLEIEALKGAPGVRSHRYSKPNPGETQDIANVRLLLNELKSVPIGQRQARFVCTLCFFVEGVALSVEAILKGTIADSPRGDHGFGYDTVFIPQGETRTLAEMPMTEKNKISHRSLALKSLVQEIKSRGISLVRP